MDATQKRRPFYVAMPPIVSIKNPRSTHTILPREIYNQVVELAVDNKMAVSTMIRTMVEDYLKRHKTPQAIPD